MSIEQLLQQSAATPSFRESLLRFLRSGQPCERIRFPRGLPPVKVERTLTRILERLGDAPIDRVSLEAESGCEFFRGRARVEAGDSSAEVEFEWNCRWKAEQLGWTDWFGLPDQTRAAREHGHDCFRTWHERPRSMETAA